MENAMQSVRFGWRNSTCDSYATSEYVFLFSVRRSKVLLFGINFFCCCFRGNAAAAHALVFCFHWFSRMRREHMMHSYVRGIFYGPGLCDPFHIRQSFRMHRFLYFISIFFFVPHIALNLVSFLFFRCDWSFGGIKMRSSDGIYLHMCFMHELREKNHWIEKFDRLLGGWSVTVAAIFAERQNH